MEHSSNQISQDEWYFFQSSLDQNIQGLMDQDISILERHLRKLSRTKIRQTLELSKKQKDFDAWFNEKDPNSFFCEIAKRSELESSRYQDKKSRKEQPGSGFKPHPIPKNRKSGASTDKKETTVDGEFFALISNKLSHQVKNSAFQLGSKFLSAADLRPSLKELYQMEAARMLVETLCYRLLKEMFIAVSKDDKEDRRASR